MTLMKPEPMGGLGLPNLQHYFWSAQLRNIISWLLGRQDSQWVEMEAKFVEPLPLNSLIFIKQFSKIRNINNCFTIVHTLRTWKDCSKKLGITNWTSINSPIYCNPDLDKHLVAVNIQNWSQLGINQFKDLFQTNMQLKSFMELKTEYNIPNTDFFKYLQMRNIIQSLRRENKLRLELYEIEELLITSTTIKGKISEVYDILSKECHSSFLPLLEIWETDLAIKFDENIWLNICDRIHFPFTSNKIKETNFKFIHKFYLTPVKMNKISNDNSPNCPRCKTNKGTFAHMFWYCEKLNGFWNSIHSFTKAVLATQFDLSPCAYLLNELPEIRMDSKKYRLLITITYYAKKCILLFWKGEQLPTFEMFKEQLIQFLPLERLTLKGHGREQMFRELWSPLLYQLGGENMD